ncbi:MAG: hypothetical protein RIB80_04585 [Rhodospirillales bacterium]
MKKTLFGFLAALLLIPAVWAAEVDDLSTTDANNTNASYGFPEGMAPSAVNDNARAFQGMIARWYQDISGAITAGGSSNAYTLSASRTISAYEDGQVFLFRAGFANSSTASLNVDSVGAKEIKKEHDEGLTSGDIEQNQMVAVVYDSTADVFQVISPLIGSGYTDPLTTRGDLLVRDASSTTRLAVGVTSGAVLKSDGTDPSWGSVAATELATAATGSIVTWDTSNDATLISGAVTSGLVLTTNGTGTSPTFQDLTELSTPQATTSGTSFTFSSIPTGTKEIVVQFAGVSLSGADDILVQIGDSGGVETSGYVATGAQLTAGGNDTTSSTAGFIVRVANASSAFSGTVTLTLLDSGAFTWIASISGKNSTSAVQSGGGNKSLSAELDRVVITRTGTDTFDAGSVNIQSSR